MPLITKITMKQILDFLGNVDRLRKITIYTSEKLKSGTTLNLNGRDGVGLVGICGISSLEDLGQPLIAV